MWELVEQIFFIYFCQDIMEGSDSDVMLVGVSWYYNLFPSPPALALVKVSHIS